MSIRRCEKCGKIMFDGFYLDGEYICSDKCLNECYTKQEQKDMDIGGDNSECYWTEWEIDYEIEEELECVEDEELKKYLTIKAKEWIMERL